MFSFPAFSLAFSVLYPCFSSANVLDEAEVETCMQGGNLGIKIKKDVKCFSLAMVDAVAFSTIREIISLIKSSFVAV